MIFTSPGAIAITIGSINIHWYGILMAIAFVFGLFVTLRIAQNQYSHDKFVKEHIWDLSTYLLIGALIGARAYYVLFNMNYYSSHFLESFQLWQGGLSIHGAILGGFITGALYSKVKKINLLKYADLFAFGLITGQVIGRWGNFFNSEAFGKPTDLPWKLFIPIDSRPLNYTDFEYFHPTFLYESITNLFILAVLYFIIRPKCIKTKGLVFFSYITLYSIFRIIIESVRIDSIYSPLGVPVAIWTSLILIVISIIAMIIICREKYFDNT